MTTIVDRHSTSNQMDEPVDCGVCESCVDGYDCEDIEYKPFVDIDGNSVAGFLPLVEADTLDEMQALREWGVRQGVFARNRAGQLVTVEMALEQDIEVFSRLGRWLKQALADGLPEEYEEFVR